MSTQTFRNWWKQELLIGLENTITVYNDDVNTFEHVIDSFVQVLKHTVEQAEQCAWIIHTKGKCKVKQGEYDILVPLCSAILDEGVSRLRLFNSQPSQFFFSANFQGVRFFMTSRRKNICTSLIFYHLTLLRCIHFCEMKLPCSELSGLNRICVILFFRGIV